MGSAASGIVTTIKQYTEGGHGGNDEWFINQNNFLRQVRNFIIDVSDADMKEIAGLHWQVAQATSIQNVKFVQSTDKDKNQIGIFAENGSGGFMNDVTFQGGAVDIRCGNQQFTTTSMSFYLTRTAIDMLWDWGWTWKNVIVFGGNVGFSMAGKEEGGSVLIMDSKFYEVDAGLKITNPKGKMDTQNFAITLQNVEHRSVSTMVTHSAGVTVLGGGDRTIASWVFGKVYDKHDVKGRYQKGQDLSNVPEKKGGLFNGDGEYYYRLKPQYEHLNANDFLNARDIATGDGKTDDSFALSILIALAADQRRPLYIPMGSYIVTKKIHVNTGSIIVGECWAQIVARGAVFEDPDDPQVMLEIGHAEEKGSIEIQDLMLTVQGPTAGAILMRLNTAQDVQGSVAIWDTHFRVGGAKGSHLQRSECPKLTGKVNKDCMAATLLLHMTSASSGYLENVWAWVADHDLDSGQGQTQIDIYAGRGILIESRDGPVWLYGTSAEHCVLYQYQLYDARNVFMGMIQTESLYYLPKPKAPAPFNDQAGRYPGDSTFSDCSDSNPHCAAAWGLSIHGCTNIHILGAGMYNWFQDYTQPCVDTQDCQQRVLQVSHSGQVWLYNLYTIGTVEMLNHDKDDPILAKSNTNMNGHPFTSVMNAWLVAYDGEGDAYDDADDEDDDNDWDLDDPLPDCRQQFSNLDDVLGQIDHLDFYCIGKYISDVSLKMLRTALSDYDGIIGNDYHKKFQVYHDAIKASAPDQLDHYMMTKGYKSDAWRCTRVIQKHCCSECGSFLAGGEYKYCFDNTCNGRPDYCLPVKSKDIACPDTKESHQQETVWHLVDDKAFFKLMEDKYGILKDWIEFADLDVKVHEGCQYNNPTPEQIRQCQAEFDIWWRDYPQFKLDFKLFDPADTIHKAFDQSQQLIQKGQAEWDNARAGINLASYNDLGDSLALPALIMSSAIDSMRKIVEVANEEIRQQRKATIAAWIEAVFFMIPVAGEVAGLVGGQIMRTIIQLAGALADVGYTIYDTVKNPDNIALGIVVGLLGDFYKEPFKNAAYKLRSAPKGEAGKITPEIRDKIEKMKSSRFIGCGK